MRPQESDNQKLCQLIGQYMKGETIMQTPARKPRLWVARQMVGLDNQNGYWQWRKHWRGRCLEAGLDPESFEVTDKELFNAWWATYEKEYQELKRKQRERRAKRNGVLVKPEGEVQGGDNSRGLKQGVAVFQLPRFKK